MKDTGIYMENETLGNYARNTAASLETQGYVRGAREERRLGSALLRLKARLSAPELRGDVAGAAEWFRDNWYLAEREGKEAAARFAGAGRLPKCAGGGARVTEAAMALVRSGRGQVTGERLRLFLEEFEKVSVLTQRELDMFVPALKGALCRLLTELEPWRGGEDRDLTEYTENIFTSLRLLSGMDAADILEDVNAVEAVLRRDPAGIYCRMDEDTRRSYRHRLSRLAEKNGLTEDAAAKKVLELAQKGPDRHVGTYIFQKPLGKSRREPTGGWYIAGNVLLTLFFTLLAGMLTGSAAVPVLLLLPVSELVKAAADFVCLRIKRPERLPRMELSGGIPRAGRTVCVISALLTGEADGKKYARLLEEYRLLNRDAGRELLFGILADLREAPEPRQREDGPILEAARSAVEELNKKYGGGFYLFYRERERNASDNVWMGRERKRGAIEDLVRLLSGERSALRALAGDEAALAGTNFILTLDADTRLTAGAARELVGAALHPLNVPVIDGKLGRVTSGYGVFEPRISVDLTSAGRSDFARIFAGEGGLDPYGAAVSDLYQDLFGEGTFMGKGLLNVPVYRRLLDGAFPENAVLSHDILEGGYLRCAYVSDTELTDGWPYKVTSWFTRQERWARGDWQNIRWCTGWVRTGEGGLRRNALSSLTKWKLFDNLRRSLTPVFTLLAVLAGLLIGGRAMGTAAVVAAASVLGGLILSTAELLARHDGSGGARYQSSVISGIAGAMLRAAIRLTLLPAEAWVQLRAAVTAVYRMTVSRKKLLAWVTSSEAERRHGNTLGVNYKSLAACPLAGALVVLLARSAPGAAVGIVWLFAPAFAWALSREIRRVRRVSQADRSFLLSRAGEIWRYFADTLTPEDNYLPPDNVQEEPRLGPAHRTSPTNIGLAMLSCAAASDLGLIGEREAVERVKRTLETCLKLRRWRGHLLNWYDTRTLTPLEPRYVSTVDSGNFVGCLIALRQWLLEAGEGDAAEKCAGLIDSADMGALFDGKRKLFYIGFDLTKGAPSEGWYDLLASEARQTSFIAVALGAVPRKHWRRLGRALVSQDGYSGMASWTGTMFEYLMPNLLLPCPENSLLYESARFCLYAQRRAGPGLPWGISESAYYAFDPGLSYRYKAHGVQRLALKRGMGTERVIAPYATYLALPLDPGGGVKNLRRLSGRGMEGRYGLYEALDLTPARARSAKGEPVRTFMAHHLGMSLVAVANTLCNDVFPRRFMADIRMGAYRELLEERIPTGQIVLRQPPREVPAVPRRAESGELDLRASQTDCVSPRCVPLSNGEYTALFAETGAVRSVWRGRDLTRMEPDMGRDAGVALYLRTREGLIPLTAAPEYDRRVKYSSTLSDSFGQVRAEFDGLTFRETLTVPPGTAGEVRHIELSAPAGFGKARLICVFEPVLERREDHKAHPAFSKLALEADFRSGVLTVRRRPKPGQEDVYLAAACDAPMTAATHFRRGEGPEGGKMLRASPDMRVALTIPVDLASGKCAVTVALAPGTTRQEAEDAARELSRKSQPQAISRLAAAALMLGLKPREVREALGLLTGLLYGARPGEARRELLREGRFGREDLWRAGISGDLPILTAKVETGEALEGALTLLRRHALLSENGVESDLALLLTDAGDYRGGQREAILKTLTSLGREGALGARGGVHLLDAGTREALAAEALADLAVRPEAIPAEAAHRERFPRKEPAYRRGGEPPRWELAEDGTFRFALGGALPEAAWSNILANQRFGYLATECGTGYMWYKNSRLMRLTPSLGDASTALGAERLELLRGEARRSLFADGTGDATLVEYGFGWARWERETLGVKTRLTAFVPEDAAARVLILELRGDLAGLEVEYSTGLTLGEDERLARAVITGREGRAFTARNPSGEFKNTVFRVLPDAEPVGFTGDWNKYRLGELDGALGAGVRPCVALRFSAAERLVIAAGCEDVPALAGLLREADGLLESTKDAWRERVGRLRIVTPDEKINALMSGWCVYQTLASRLIAKTGLYQNGGATGFRDQLQDACALTLVDPERCRRQIMTAAAHQYREGDVMHWWHDTPGGVMGVRTRCSDDLLWLPYALTDYVTKTGDTGLCREETGYLSSPPLKPEERDRYERPGTARDSGTVLRHAMDAADAFLSRGTGRHGLALMLGGDWNDGFDRVGARGQGESVWLTFFASLTLRRLSELCGKLGEAEPARRYLRASSDLLRAGEGTWTGEWYLRGTFDDGTPLGAPSENAPGECELDSIAQSFAVFAGADAARSRQAVMSAYKRLFDSHSRVAKLFDPPFDAGDTCPGYIRAYAPGFRENGGQYTHAAVWLAMALLRAGRRREGAELLSALSPWGRDGDVYAVEPYVLAADVYSAPGHVGRGGWTWYTGSAGWYLRAVAEELLGLHLREGRLYVEPKLPESLLPCHAVLRGREELRIDIYPQGILINGEPYKKEGLPYAPPAAAAAQAGPRRDG